MGGSTVGEEGSSELKRARATEGDMRRVLWARRISTRGEGCARMLPSEGDDRRTGEAEGEEGGTSPIVRSSRSRRYATTVLNPAWWSIAGDRETGEARAVESDDARRESTTGAWSSWRYDLLFANFLSPTDEGVIVSIEGIGLELLMIRLRRVLPALLDASTFALSIDVIGSLTVLVLSSIAPGLSTDPGEDEEDTEEGRMALTFLKTLPHFLDDVAGTGDSAGVGGRGESTVVYPVPSIPPASSNAAPMGGERVKGESDLGESFVPFVKKDDASDPPQGDVGSPFLIDPVLTFARSWTRDGRAARDGRG